MQKLSLFYALTYFDPNKLFHNITIIKITSMYSDTSANEDNSFRNHIR